MVGARLIVGLVVMGLLVPTTLFLLLPLSTLGDFVTVGACAFSAWATGDLLAAILSRPRLKNRPARQALRDWEPIE